jgi:hypothetical protein
LPQRLFENLLHTVRDEGFHAYEVGDLLPDGRLAWDADPLKLVRRLGDDLQRHLQEDVYRLGFVFVVESMVGFTGATNIHISILPNRPTDKGVLIKTLCDARTRVMVAFEFVESKEEQSLKRYVEEGRAAGVCLRLTEPWHNQGPRLLIADAWFGGVPTSYALWQRGWFKITNVKTHTKHFCKKELWADARSDRRNHERNDRAYRQVTLRPAGKEISFTAAFHMDKAMTLLGTMGSSAEAPEVMRRVYMDDFGDLQTWHGLLKQPMIHYTYRSSFNAVDIHSKLALGPRSMSKIGTDHLLLKVFLKLLAMAEINAYLVYKDRKKLTSDEYCHGDFKADLERRLLRLAQQEEAVAKEAPAMETSPATRQSAAAAPAGGDRGHR